MADILGPSGQPIKPNPFTSPQSQQDLSANISINTQSAQQAMADFQKSLDGMMKAFGGSWDKVSKDSMAAQERFYRYIGDKQKESEISLKRYSKEAIAGIEAEKAASLAALEAKKLAHSDFEKEKIKITANAENARNKIIEETTRKEKQSKGFSGLIRGASDVLTGVGGPIGSSIAGVANLVTNPEIAIPAAIIGAIIEALGAKAAFTKTGAQLAGAGLGLGSPATTGLNFAQNLFGDTTSRLSRALSSDQQRSIIEGMTGSRTMIGQATGIGGFDSIRRNLGLFANILPDASKEMELFTDATKSLGMSQKDISTTFFQSSKNSKDLKITQLDSLATQIEMQKALRNITNDGAVAASVLDNVGSFFHSIGKSETETQRMTLGIAQAGANLPLSQIAGMFSFTRGGKMPTEQDLFGINGVGGMMGKQGSGVFGLMGSFLSKVGGQFKDPMQRIFAADALNRQLGLGIQTQDLPKFFDLSNRLMTGGVNEKDYAKQVAELAKQGNKMTIDGMDTLVSIVPPLTQLGNMFSNFWRDIDSRLADIVSAIHDPLHFNPNTHKELWKPGINNKKKADGSHPTK